MTKSNPKGGSAAVAKERLRWLRDGGEWMMVRPAIYQSINIPLGPMRIFQTVRPVYRWVYA